MTICSRCRRAAISARRSTTRWPTSRSTIRSSPVSCRARFKFSPALYSKNCSRRFPRFPHTLEYDAFGRIYEYFLGEFARTEGQKGGEFFTPSCIVRLIVQILEPYHGRVLDPACGSGGMFVQSARFVQEHREEPIGRAVPARPGTGRRDRCSLAYEPCRSRTRRRYPRGQLVLRRRARQHGELRLCPRQSAVQRQRGRQGPAQRRRRQEPTLSVWSAAHRQRQLSLDSALLFRAQQKRPRRFRHGQLRLRRPRLRARAAKTTDRSSRRRRDGRRRPECFLHRHTAVHAVVPGQGQRRSHARRAD